MTIFCNCTLFLPGFRTYKIASPPPTIMTNKDDIWGVGVIKVPSSMAQALSGRYWFLHSTSFSIKKRRDKDPLRIFIFDTDHGFISSVEKGLQTSHMSESVFFQFRVFSILYSSLLHLLN